MVSPAARHPTSGTTRKTPRAWPRTPPATSPTRSGIHAACGAPRRSHHAIGADRREARGRRGAYFSQLIFEPDRSLCSPHIRRGMLNVGTIGVSSRKLARPAGFEPATPGLEGWKFLLSEVIRSYPKLSEVIRSYPKNSLDHEEFTGRFQVVSGRSHGRSGGRTGPPRIAWIIGR